MFVSRFTQARIDELTTLRERVLQLSVQLASAKTHNDWLETRVTSLELERASLTERLLEVRYPVPVMTRANERPAGTVEVHGRTVDDEPASTYVVPPHLKDSMPAMPAMAGPAPRRRPAPSAEEEMQSSISALQASAATFDDVGDEAAAAIGAEHDDAGNVHYTK